MVAISMQEAQATLPELIHRLRPGDAMQITEDGRAMAVVTAYAPETRRMPKLGTQRGSVVYMSPDFDAPLEDFREYTE